MKLKYIFESTKVKIYFRIHEGQKIFLSMKLKYIFESMKFKKNYYQ